MSAPLGAGDSTAPDVPDDISVTSTLDSQHDPDDEFTVERVLAEDTSEDGDQWYLVQWTGYPIHRWSWEPEANLTETCLEDWRAIQQQQARGELEEFDRSIWENAVAEAQDAKFARHRRRNERRKREGLALNLYQGETEADYYDSDEDVGTDDFNEILPPPKPKSSQNASMVTPPAPKKQKAEPQKRKKSKEDSQSSRTSTTKSSTQVSASSRKGLPSSADSSPPRRPSVNSAAAPETAPAARPANIRRASGTELVRGTAPAAARPSNIRRASEAELSRERAPAAARPVNVRRASGTELLRKMAPATARPVVPLPASTQNKSTSTGRPSGLQGKKSNAPPGLLKRPSSSNVFIGGKKTRTKPKFVDNMVDQTKQPKRFGNHHIARKAELLSREVADKAPTDPSSLHLFNISTGVAVGVPSKKTDVTSPAVSSPVEQTKSALRKNTDNHADSDGHQQPPARKSRSVRFTGDEPEANGAGLVQVRFFEDVEMTEEPVAAKPNAEEDDALLQQRRPPTPPRNSEGAAPSRVSGVPLQHPMQTFQDQKKQDTGKKIMFGPAGSTQVFVILKDLPRGPEAWNLELLRDSALQITHQCMSQAFLTQGQIRETILASGDVVVADGEDRSLEGIAESLRLGSFGLGRLFDTFGVLLFPTGCHSWAMAVPEADSLSASCALKYLVFRPNALVGPVPKVPASFQTDEKKVPGGALSYIVHQMFGLDYSQLLPTALHDTPDQHSIFLAFPPSKQTVSNLIGSWIRDVNPLCKIFTSAIAGDWHAFAMQGRGAVILHQKARALLRVLPGLNELLRRGEPLFTFWSLQEKLQHGGVAGLSAASSPFGLVRLFPQRNIVFLTPSFLVTQPGKAREFFLWYKVKWKQPGFSTQLAFSSGITGYLEEVAREKAHRRRDILSSSRSDVATTEKQASDLGLSHADCNARFELAYHVNGLISISKLEGKLAEHFVFAEETIHPDDEQSLVNWFGYWSLSNLDRFRKFVVIGSSPRDLKRATRIMACPAWEPDASAKSDTTGSPIGDTDMLSHETNILSSDGGSEFRNYLFSIHSASAPFLQLYGLPVSYFARSREMADHFGDTSLYFETFETWLKWVRPFHQSKRNTHVALFYTIDEEWNPKTYAAGKMPFRRPWIGVYRVKNPGRKPWIATELIIWDPRASETCSSEPEPRASELMPAQRALIEAVQDIGSKRNPGLPLEVVWYGGFEGQYVTAQSTVIDRTLEMVKLMTVEPAKFLPLPEHMMEDRRFRKLRENTRRPPNDPMAAEAATRALVPDMDPERPKNMVFHPPRAPGVHVGGSACENFFFQHFAPLQGSTRPQVYNFRPTQEWYGQQKKEGRHFEFMQVGDWEPLFKLLKISPVTGEGQVRSGPSTPRLG